MEERPHQQLDRRIPEPPAHQKPTDLSPRTPHYTSPLHNPHHISGSHHQTTASRHNTTREDHGSHNLSTNHDKNPSPKQSPGNLHSSHSNSFNTSKTSPQSSTGSSHMPSSCERQSYPLTGSAGIPGTGASTSPYMGGYGGVTSPEQMYYPHHSAGLMPSMTPYPYHQMSYLSHNNACALTGSGATNTRESTPSGYPSSQTHVPNTLPSCTYMGSQAYGLFPSNMSSANSIPS